MSKPKPLIAIVGLGLVGSSIGMALRKEGLTSAVVGHDVDRNVNNLAKKRGAVDRTNWNLISACDEADMVILSMPVGGIEETLRVIGPELRPGCVVVDTATVKRPVLAWAEKYLPESVHFVGANPILSTSSDGQGGVEAARADLFQGGLFGIVPGPRTNEDAIKLATDLVYVLGAKPLFLDADEHDGLMAAVEHLPALLALALTEMVTGQPSWRELRKVAGPTFELGTQLIATEPVAHSGACVANQDNVLRWIDTFSASLASLRQGLAQGEPEALAARFDEAYVDRQKWLADRTAGQWHEGPKPEMPARPNIVNSLFGSFWRRKPKQED